VERGVVNPFDLTATGLMVWGLVAHLIADWPLQNDWMANNKATSLKANAVHAGIHGLALALVFGWAAVPLAVAHGLIDTRKPVVWWSKLVGQTQPGTNFELLTGSGEPVKPARVPLYDVGTEVRFWTDQVFHIACIAVAALAVAS
jgi:hypothetical protein